MGRTVRRCGPRRKQWRWQPGRGCPSGCQSGAKSGQCGGRRGAAWASWRLQERLRWLEDISSEVEKRHYKLWLASKAVLERALHNAAVTRSEFKVEQVYEKAKRYVASNAFPTAMKMLDEHRVVIIAGPPGVGKTTLVDLLLYRHLEAGYSPVLIQKTIEQGEELLIDYDFDLGEEFEPCRCGHPRCRGLMLRKKDWPKLRGIMSKVIGMKKSKQAIKP